LREHQAELARRDVAVLVVTFEASWVAEAYVRETGLPWPLVIDEDRTLYRAYGMQRGRWWDLAGPAAIWAYLKLMTRGRWPRRPTGDVAQLGGDVLVDPAGTVRLRHVGSGPADRPPVKRLLALVHGAAADANAP
jgi:hypothetical protein